MLRVPVDRLEKRHLPAARDLLARAFEDDPFFRFLCPDARRRPTMVGEIMRSSCSLAMSAGQAGAVLDPDLSGVCLYWGPRTHPPPLASTIRHRGAAMLRAARAGHARLSELLTALRTGEVLEEVLPKAPHYYLAVLAVEPTKQGRGIGSGMLRECTARADADGVEAYLETSKPANVPLYERHGFVVFRTQRIDGSPPLWSMRRAPGAGLR